MDVTPLYECECGRLCVCVLCVLCASAKVVGIIQLHECCVPNAVCRFYIVCHYEWWKIKIGQCDANKSWLVFWFKERNAYIQAFIYVCLLCIFMFSFGLCGEQPCFTHRPSSIVTIIIYDNAIESKPESSTNQTDLLTAKAFHSLDTVEH